MNLKLCNIQAWKTRMRKEIYEGDIIKWTRTKKTLVSYVYFDNNFSCFMTKGFYIRESDSKHYEVIGNIYIYENKELLND